MIKITFFSYFVDDHIENKMYSDKVKLNDKPSRMKFRSGDVIIRSEYDDCVIRDNSRAVNRLNSQMMTFERAQKVIMKDIGKETQIIRSKMVNMVSTSPRNKYSSQQLNNFASGNKKSSKNSKKRPGDEQSPTGKPKVESPPFKSPTEKHMYTIADEAKRRYAKKINKTKSVSGETDNLTDNESSNDTPTKSETQRMPLSLRKHESMLSISSRNDNINKEKTPRTDRIKESAISSQMSARNVRKEAIASLYDENKRQASASHMSFIQILQKADEAKSKGLTIEDHVPRPRTPELLSDCDSDESEVYRRRKPNKLGATPKSTYISQLP